MALTNLGGHFGVQARAEQSTVRATVMQNNPNTNFVGARKGAIGTLDDLQSKAPIPKDWLLPSLVKVVMGQLKANQLVHSPLNLDIIIYNHFFNSSNDRYRIIWS